MQATKLNYDPETDSLYIDLAERQSAASREISDGVVLDYDAQGTLVGIDSHVSKIIHQRVFLAPC
ncbi:MAG: DUF2283 domain-containing protein [Gammaproteobacteria bacterium]|nr:DUF2283 domain-containing protein [Gammaproteobacteria bacterium]